jgi:hypothetical protein
MKTGKVFFCFIMDSGSSAGNCKKLQNWAARGGRGVRTKGAKRSRKDRKRKR